MVERRSTHGGALFSADEIHRYLLWRNCSLKPTGTRRLLVIGLNPSTATEDKGDPTIARCVTRAVAMR